MAGEHPQRWDRFPTSLIVESWDKGWQPELPVVTGFKPIQVDFLWQAIPLASCQAD